MTRAALCMLLFTAALSAQRPILPRPPAPDLVLFNGKVITVDRDFSIHQAVAIIGDRIMAVGNDDQMRTVAGPSSVVQWVLIGGTYTVWSHFAGGVDVFRTCAIPQRSAHGLSASLDNGN